MNVSFLSCFIPALLLFLPYGKASELPTVHVGSKNFTEGYILSEIIAQKIENSGLAKVERHFGMGGTGILFGALKTGEVDIYPEYTGTLTHTILNRPELEELSAIQAEARRLGLQVSAPLGFNNSYGIAVSHDQADKLGLKTIGDLAKLAGKPMAFSHEFLEREDGFRALSKFYGMGQLHGTAIEHALAYPALSEGSISATDIYTTDAKIKRYGFKILEDDKGFFPKYEGVLLASESFVKKHPQIWELLRTLEGHISNELMITLNARAELEKQSFAAVASEFLGVEPAIKERGYWRQILTLTREHMVLVGISLLFSILAGVPLGLLAAHNRWVGQSVLTLSGLLQTIPSLALLAFLIPFFGIGLKPSLIALFLYGLLPIVRGTYSGLKGLDPKLLEVGRALGLSAMERLRLIEIPLASIHILSGIKTSAIINVGTATLAALIGAGGYGTLILTGLSLNSNEIILRGAIPAAAMALMVHAVFELMDRLLIPKGLK